MKAIRAVAMGLWRRVWRWVTGIEGAERALVQRHIDYFEHGED